MTPCQQGTQLLVAERRRHAEETDEPEYAQDDPMIRHCDPRYSVLDEAEFPESGRCHRIVDEDKSENEQSRF